MEKGTDRRRECEAFEPPEQFSLIGSLRSRYGPVEELALRVQPNLESPGWRIPDRNVHQYVTRQWAVVLDGTRRSLSENPPDILRGSVNSVVVEELRAISCYCQAQQDLFLGGVSGDAVA